MRNSSFLRAMVCLPLVSAACAGAPQDAQAPSAAAPAPVSSAPSGQAAAPATVDNPLLSKWGGPYGGVPPLAKIKVTHFRPAFEVAMEEKRREIAAIANDAAAPTFDNTIVRLEDAGRTLKDVDTLYNLWTANMSTPEIKAVEREMAPKLAAFADEITQNEKLFQRIQAVYESPDKSKLTPEQQRLTWRHYMKYARAGAKLDAPSKKRLADLHQKLASLTTTFTQNVMADEEARAVVLESEADLAGLPESIRASAAKTAEARGAKGKWVIANTRSGMASFLANSTRGDLREKVWKAFYGRGDNGDANDNNKVISDILKLRAERAKLLGYATHAHWQLEDRMAKTPERAVALMESLWKPAFARMREEVAVMQALAKKDKAATKNGKGEIAPWDYAYYGEKVRKATYDLDENEVTPYLQLEKLREGMFWVAGELFGFAFTPVSDVEVLHPDVRVWEVKNKATGKRVGLWYFDPYARAGKRSGAWMTEYRGQERFKTEVTPIVSNNSNFLKGQDGKPVLISWQDARTLFHEFGHALHGLSSNVTYPTLAGTNVALDYVEFPSQLLEHWLSTPEVLNRFALHYETGAPMPRALAAKLEKTVTFQAGLTTVQYLSSAIIDMKLYLAGAKEIDPDAFERESLKALGITGEPLMVHRLTAFKHIFSGGDDYSAGYYSYLWSDTLTADAYEAFTEGKGPYDATVAERLRKNLFSVGDTVEAAAAYRAFRGKDAEVSALMRKRGFAERRAKNPT